MNQELTQTLLLGAFALALALACRSLLGFVLGTLHWPRWVQWTFVVAAVAVSAVLAADAIGQLEASNQSPRSTALALSVCVLAMLSLPLYRWGSMLRLPSRELALRPACWIVLAWSLGACAWSGSRLHATVIPIPEELTSSPRPELLNEPLATAITDRGRTIPLFRMQSEVPGWPNGFQATTAALQEMMQTVIHRAGPDATANCHGWVFAGGKYLLDGNGVQAILEDNGYEVCRVPQPGDLIVYWSGRFITHTGLVSGVLADGTVVIESKWNLQERFLHRPEDQPYSREFTYYRTARGSHEITIRDVAEGAK